VPGVTNTQQIIPPTMEREAWTLLHAMKKVKHKEFDSIRFQGDSDVLVDVIHTKKSDNFEFNINLLKQSLLCHYINFEVKFVRRQPNMVVLTLVGTINFWVSFHKFEIIILCVDHLLVNEMH
jgi:hypothetical protein